MTEKQRDETIKGRILGLLQKGYTRSQLINDFNFAERTVDSAIKEWREQQNNEADGPKKGDDYDSKGLVLPAKLDTKQVIVPEYLIKHLSFVNGDQRQTFVDALLVYEAARRSVMEDIVILQGLAAAQAQVTDTQLKVLREAKSESKEVAQAAAEEVAARVAAYFDQKKPDIATTPDPMKGFIARAMETMWDRITGAVFGGAQGGQPQLPPGWRDLRM
jgi:hypothetical protein